MRKKQIFVVDAAVYSATGTPEPTESALPMPFPVSPLTTAAGAGHDALWLPEGVPGV